MKSTLSKLLENPLSDLRGLKQIIFVSASKNLAPVAVTIEQYIKDALAHLLDSSTYEILFSSETEARDGELRVSISNWILKYAIHRFRNWHKTLPRVNVKSHKGWSFGCFYLRYNIHKTPLKIRPVRMLWLSLYSPCLRNLCGSHAAAHGKNHALLLQRLLCPHPNSQELQVRQKCNIFSFDVSLCTYTNINTDECLDCLTEFLLRPSTETARFLHYPAKTLVEVLSLVMKNNRMRFGDIIV